MAAFENEGVETGDHPHGKPEIDMLKSQRKWLIG